MGTLKIKGQTSGSVSLKAPDTGSDAILTLPGVTGELLPLAGGKILQIVRATDSTDRSTTSTSFVDASISVTITPQKSDSIVLLLWRAFVVTEATASTLTLSLLQITDNSNNAISGSENQGYGVLIPTITTAVWYGPAVEIAYATPATTSAVTYKGRFRVAGGGRNINISNTETTGQLYAIEVSA